MNGGERSSGQNSSFLHNKNNKYLPSHTISIYVITKVDIENQSSKSQNSDSSDFIIALSSNRSDSACDNWIPPLQSKALRDSFLSLTGSFVPRRLPRLLSTFKYAVALRGYSEVHWKRAEFFADTSNSS